jgi:hypothetical protein
MEYEDEALIRTERPSPEIVPGVFSKEDRSYFARRARFRPGPCPPNRKGPVLPINAQDRTRYVPLPHWRVLAAEFPFRMEPKRVRWNCRTTGGECWKHRSLA